MSRIELKAIDSGGVISVPTSVQTVIGRGPFLQVVDKRVSRNHGMLEVIGGKLYLTPTHINPCFYQKHGTKDKVALPKDKQKCLEAGDLFSLLPSKLAYEVTYRDVQNGTVKQEDDERKPEGSLENKKSAADGNKLESKEAVIVKQEKKNDGSRKESMNASDGVMTQQFLQSPQESKEDAVHSMGRKKIALPLQKKRKLPNWLVQAAAAVEDSTSKKLPQSRTTTTRKTSAKTSSRPKKYYVYESVDEEEEEEDPEILPTKRRKTTRVESFKGAINDPPMLSRRPSRAAATKKNSYDEYSDEDDLKTGHGRYKKDFDDDEDFIAEDDEDSGSDWEKRKQKVSHRGRGRGRGAPVKKTPGRKKKKKRDSDDDSEDFDSYIPRPSKRRAAARASEEEEHSQQEKKARVQCHYGHKCYRKNPSHFKDYSHPGDDSYNEDSDEQKDKSEEEEEDKRPECPYGTNCYRKNVPHRKEFKHTQKTDADHSRQKNSSKAKTTIVDGESDDDDDGLPNTYSYDDSFINDQSQPDKGESFPDPADEDSDWEPEVDQEEAKALKKEARGILKNKKSNRN